MGMPKLFLPYDEDENFLRHIVRVYVENGAGRVVVVVNETDFEKITLQDSDDKVQFVINKEVEKGRFRSIALGISCIKSEVPLFVHNIDNPFIDGEIIGSMLRRLHTCDYAVPVYQQRSGHPVLLGKKVIQALRAAVSAGDMNFKTFLREFKRGTVEVSNAGILANINTPEEYIRYGFNPDRLPTVF